MSEWNDGSRVGRTRQNKRKRREVEKRHYRGRKTRSSVEGTASTRFHFGNSPSPSHFAWGVRPRKAYRESKYSPGPFAPYFALLAAASLPTKLSRKDILLTNPGIMCARSSLMLAKMKSYKARDDNAPALTPARRQAEYKGPC